MTSYRFLDAMGDLVEESDFEDHAAALAWARGTATTTRTCSGSSTSGAGRLALGGSAARLTTFAIEGAEGMYAYGDALRRIS